MDTELIKKRNHFLEVQLEAAESFLQSIKSALSLLTSHHGAVSYPAGNRMEPAFKWLFLTGLISLKPTQSPEPGIQYFEARMFNHLSIELQEKLGMLK